MVSEAAPRCINSPGGGSKGGIEIGTGQNVENLFSPRFKSVAAMAGWDEEALIIASLVVEDTPERNSSTKHKRRSDLLFKTPPSSSSRRKRRAKKSPGAIPVVDLDKDVIGNEENEKEETVETMKTDINKKKENRQSEKNMKVSGTNSVPSPVERTTKTDIQKEKKNGGDERVPGKKNEGVSATYSGPPCIDKLREELSCAICLEICFEPSTTSCGHSFCKKCLQFAAHKCGKKCPKCRQLISNGRFCTVNTVLWNTIQLLFPQEVETRRNAAAGDLSCKAVTNPRNTKREESHTSRRNPTTNPIATNSNRAGRDDLSRLIVGERSERRRRGVRPPSQDRDAAFALRLQRQEFMEAFGDEASTMTTTTEALSIARANLRAMASRAVQIRQRRRDL